MAEKLAFLKKKGGAKNTPTLLWTNPSPLSTSGFPAQTLSLDLSKYEGVLIESLVNTNSTLDGFRMPVYVPKDGVQKYVEGGQLKVVPPASNFVATIYARLVTVTDSGITFSIGYAGATTGNALCIPYRIYGL